MWKKVDEGREGKEEEGRGREGKEGGRVVVRKGMPWNLNFPLFMCMLYATLSTLEKTIKQTCTKLTVLNTMQLPATDVQITNRCTGKKKGNNNENI